MSAINVPDKESTIALAQRSHSDLSLDDVNRMFVGLAELAREEGIDAFLDSVTDRFMATGFGLMLDGNDPQLVQVVLETLMSSLMHEHEVRYRKMLEGIMAIRSGDNPQIVGQKLSMIF